MTSAQANSTAQSQANTTGKNISPAGAWLVAIHANDTGTVRVPMNFTPIGQDRFVAHSRPGALRSLVGFWKSLIARLFSGKVYARGALFHITQGSILRSQEAMELRGNFLLPLLGEQSFQGTLTEDKFVGTLTQTNGEITATIDAKRSSANTPTRNYAEVANEIQAILQEKFYHPPELTRPVWIAAFTQLRERFDRTHDDAEALMHFKLAMRGVGISHFALVGENFGERLPKTTSAPEPDAVKLSFATAQIAQLTFRHFRGGPDAVDAAFAELAKSQATSLIIDLRGNPGGNLSAMAVAAHLVEKPIPAGIFIGAAWWRHHEAPPNAAQIAKLKTLDSFSQQDFFDALQKHGAFRGQVLPRSPFFPGSVFVLVDQRTASAAEPLAELLSHLRQVTVIGEKTAGRMLSSETVGLSSGLSLILPTADYFTAAGRRLEGTGFKPGIEVKSSEAFAAAMQMIAEND